MRLGDLQSIPVEDVTLMTNMSWGDLKKAKKTLDKLVQDAKNLPEGEDNEDAQFSFAEETLLKFVVSCEGLEDKAGQPITKLTGEYIDELPPSFVMNAMEGLLSVGDESKDASGN